jgi:hypothetical protein
VSAFAEHRLDSTAASDPQSGHQNRVGIENRALRLPASARMRRFLRERPLSTSLANAPSDVCELWGELDYEVTWLHSRWQIYRQLFGTSEERVEILNHSAGTFALVLQPAARRRSARALEARGRGKGRTLQKLDRHCIGSSSFEPRTRPRADSLSVKSYQDACDKIRTRRNKWIAHSDHDTLANRHATTLTGPSREEIELALSALRELRSLVTQHDRHR